MKTSTILAAAAALATTAQAIDTNATAADLTSRQLADTYKYVMYGVDLVVPNSRSYQAGVYKCFDDCKAASTSTCGGASWNDYNGGTCWVKNTNAQFVGSKPNAGVISIFKLATNQGPVTWSFTTDGADIPNNDLANYRRSSMDECKTLCAGTTGCYAVTWTDFEGGTCWLKQRASAYVNKPGAKSAYLSRIVF